MRISPNGVFLYSFKFSWKFFNNRLIINCNCQFKICEVKLCYIPQNVTGRATVNASSGAHFLYGFVRRELLLSLLLEFILTLLEINSRQPELSKSLTVSRPNSDFRLPYLMLIPLVWLRIEGQPWRGWWHGEFKHCRRNIDWMWRYWNCLSPTQFHFICHYILPCEQTSVTCN
jgi:hypothetical protein